MTKERLGTIGNTSITCVIVMSHRDHVIDSGLPNLVFSCLCQALPRKKSVQPTRGHASKCEPWLREHLVYLNNTKNVGRDINYKLLLKSRVEVLKSIW